MKNRLVMVSRAESAWNHQILTKSPSSAWNGLGRPSPINSARRDEFEAEEAAERLGALYARALEDGGADAVYDLMERLGGGDDEEDGDAWA